MSARSKNNLIALGFLLSGSGLIWLIDQASDRAEREQLQIGAQITGEQLQLRLQSCIAPRLNLINLASRGWESVADLETNWQTAVRTSFGVLPGMQALNYVDTGQIIRRTYPLAGNESVLGANLGQHPNPSVRAAIDRAAQSEAMQRTTPVELLQSGLGLALYKRIHGPQGEALGFVNAVFRIEELINTCFAERNLRGQFVYRIIESDGSIIFSETGGSDPDQWQLASLHTVLIANQPWTLELAPAPGRLQNFNLLVGNLWLEVGLVLVALLAIVMRAWLNNQDSLCESQARYQLLVENQSDLIIKLDLQGRFHYVSPSFCRFIGQDEEALLGRNFMIIVDELEQESVREKFLSLSPSHRQTHMTQRIRVNQELHWISWAGSLVLDEKGRPDCIVAVGRDVTDQMNMEAQIAHSEKMRAVGELAGGISHDFNNLLQVILANIELLISAPERSDKESRLDNIRHAVTNGIELTNRLSTLSKQDHGKLESFDLFELVSQSLNLIERSLPENIALDASGVPVRAQIDGNKSQLERVLLNLCFNARDAIEGEGRIEINGNIVELDEDFCQAHKHLRPGKYACLEVVDNGKGMDESVLARIFEPFFSTKRKSKGTGLGLANCYSIVSQHHGLIQVQSEPGKGSRFQVYLPLSRYGARNPKPDADNPATATSPLPASSRETASAAPDTSPGKVLVADDNEALLTTIQSFLEVEKYEVIRATDGQQALEKFRQHRDKISFVILDLMIPKRDGKQAADEIRALAPQTRILFISGYVADSDMLLAMQEEVMLRKPFTRIELLGAINRLLNARQP